MSSELILLIETSTIGIYRVRAFGNWKVCRGVIARARAFRSPTVFLKGHKPIKPDSTLRYYRQAAGPM